MPEQFVNPSPFMEAGSIICFDFPCKDIPRGIGVEQPSPAAGSDTYVAYSSGDHRVWGNLNLRAPGIELLYGRLGKPKRQQGHPFIKEFDPGEQEDPTAGEYGDVFLDQIVDIDRGVQINHTGRLSGDFSPFFASKPFYSTILVSAVPVDPVDAGSASIRLTSFIKWLEPMPEAPNVWYWRKSDPNTQELMFTSDVRLGPDPAIFKAEVVYKLVLRWKFWKYTGPAPYPANPPNPEDPASKCIGLNIRGFDDAITFEVSSPTHEL